MKVLIVGNYEFDGSTSMKIWANTLYSELLQLGIDASLVSPKPVLGRLKKSSKGAGKWFGYFDRFILFPRQLREAAAKADVVHLCDHGSAMYAAMVNGKPVVVTCNDMIGVRSALGELPEIRASFFGRFLQKWICRGLLQATKVACISHATLTDARRILKDDRNLLVILDGLNHPFRRLPASEVDSRLALVNGIDAPYVLHVGSNAAYKNREGVLRVFARAREGTKLQLVFAGEALSKDLLRLAEELGVRGQIVQVVKPPVDIIEALYNRAAVLLFPSRYEGFGWPPIEAQACGCPVVASNIAPIAEVLAESAALRPVEDEAGMAEEVQRLVANPEHQVRMRELGLENVRVRFQTSRMMDEYVSLYREVAGASGDEPQQHLAIATK